MGEKQTGILLLLLIYLSLIAVISLRIVSDPAQYITHDSIKYLEKADALLVQGFNNKDNSNTKPFTIWPIGYPLLISLTSFLTGTSTLIASKLLNYISIGLMFLILFKWSGGKAWFSALYFFSYSSIEIFTHTWSDGPFLLVVLVLTYLISISHLRHDRFLFFKITICLLALFLLRYVGVVYFFFVAGVMIYYWFQKELVKVKHYFIGLIISSLGVLSYFYHNKLVSGYYFGLDRRDVPNDSIFDILLEIGHGVINELSLARNIYAIDPMDWLYIILILIQIVITYKVYINSRDLTLQLDIQSKVLIISGFTYFIMLVLFRFSYIITEFNYRILAPTSTLFIIVLFSSIAVQKNYLSFEQNKKWIAGFMILSLLMNLPKRYLFDLLLQ